MRKSARLSLIFALAFVLPSWTAIPVTHAAVGRNAAAPKVKTYKLKGRQVSGSLAVDAKGNIYIDSGNANLWAGTDSVVKLSPKGQVLASGDGLGVDSDHPDQAAGIALGALPLVALTQNADMQNCPNDCFAPASQWDPFQDELASASTNSVHVMAMESGHNMPLERPQLVVEAVREMLAAARAPRTRCRRVVPPSSSSGVSACPDDSRASGLPVRGQVDGSHSPSLHRGDMQVQCGWRIRPSDASWRPGPTHTPTPPGLKDVGERTNSRLQGGDEYESRDS